MDPGAPLDKDIYDLDPEELSPFPRCPARSKTLSTPWNATTIPAQRRCLYRRLLRTYVDYKRSKEVDAIRQRPHPCEFALYYDI